VSHFDGLQGAQSGGSQDDIVADDITQKTMAPIGIALAPNGSWSIVTLGPLQFVVGVVDIFCIKQSESFMNKLKGFELLFTH
jgi:hypothetical protein